MKPATRSLFGVSRSGSGVGRLPEPLAVELARLLGPAGFIEEADRLLAYESDALTRIRGTPLAVVLPDTREQLQHAVRLLYEAGIPFVPRGAGTGLTGGAVARGEVLLGTARLDRFLRLAPAERLAVVEPGVITEEISRRAEPFGLRYLPDPGSATACTIGGNVATNAGGPHCLKHGVTSDHVLGLEVVLPDGRLLGLDRGEAGGPDLAGLFLGSEGTLGIVASATVRLAPRPDAVLTSLVLFDGIGEAGQAVTEILSAGVVPVALEIIDGTTIRTVERSPFAVGLPTDVAAALVVECEGTAEEAGEEMSAALAAAEVCAPRQILSAASEAERERLWRARKSAYGALGRLGPDVLVEDTVVPRTALAGLLPRIEQIADRHGLRLASFFHAGDGNLHPNIVFDAMDPDESERVEAARLEILDLCIEADGTITGEHGIGLDKLKSVPRVFGAAELHVLRSLRHAFDARGLCNPGKAVPETEGDGLSGQEGSDAAGDEGGREGSEQTGAGDGDAVWRAPSTPAELQRVAAARAAGSALLATGAREPRPGTPAIPEDATVVSTAALGGTLDHRRDDLTVTVGAGCRVGDLMAALRRERQWIPLDGPALALSVGGLVAAAPPTPFGDTFGPLRRQLLALRVVSPAGGAQRWGRPVMKNVAGYDLPGLHCGGFGRFGVITEVTFRLWPLPPSSCRLVGRGPATLRLARWLADGGDDVAGGAGGAERVAADGVRWTFERDGDGVVEERLVLWLLGSERSTASRREKLDTLAGRLGVDLQRDPELATSPPVAAARDPRGGEPSRCSVRIRVPDSDLWLMPERLVALVGGGAARVDLLPGSGILVLGYERGVDGGSGPNQPSPLVEGIFEAVAGASVTVERAGPEEHEAVRARRPASLAALQRRVVAAAGGQVRCWQADYL